VAEHRAAQHAALLDAARSLLAEGGVGALTFPALAERTGLARPSVYEYFRSRGALVEELCATDLPRWAAEVAAAMDGCATPAEKVAAYVRRQLELAADPRHRAVAAIAAGELDGAARERIRAAHGTLADPVVAVLADLGHTAPRTTAALVQGVVDAAVRASDTAPAGRADAVADAAVRLVLHGVLPGGQGDTGDGQQPGGPGGREQ
jgi:AcrR family transcriptional regulator